VDRALGLLLLAVYIVAVVGFAALVTFVVIKLFPTERTPRTPQEPGNDGRPPSGGSTRGGSVGGRLYRRAKRGAA
jgi:hypothetical protein